MDLITNGKKQKIKGIESELFKQSNRELQAPGQGQKPSGEERLRKKDEKRKQANKLIRKFKSKAGEVKAEARFMEGQGISMYQPAARTQEEFNRDQHSTKKMRDDHHNDNIDIYDERIAHKIVAAAKALADQQPQNLNADQANAAVEEVLSFNFSLSMTNKKWLCDNMDAFFEMQRKARSITTLISSVPGMMETIPGKIRKVLELKAAQGKSLFESIAYDLKERGVEISVGLDAFEIKAMTAEEYQQRTAGQKLRSVDAREAFIAAKSKEAAIGDGEEDQARNESVADTLTFEDFAAMIGTMNRGQVTIRNGKLTIINNGKFCRKRGEASEMNRTIKERFMTVILERLGEKEAAIYRPHLMTLLHLYDKDDRMMLPLTRKTIQSVLSEVNAFRCRAIRLVRNAQGHENNADVKMAKKAFDLIGNSPVTKTDRRAAKSRINALIGESRRLGLGRMSLSEHQMDNLLNGNLELLIDNIYDDLAHLDNVILNISGGADADPDAWTNGEDVVKRIALYEIKKLVENTSGGQRVARQRLSLYMTEQAFAIAGKNQLKDDMDAMYIGSISRQGAEGLVEAIEEKRQQVGDDRFDSQEFQDKVSDFALLLAHFQAFAVTAEEFITRTDSDFRIDADEFIAMAQSVDEQLAQQGKFDEILELLQGTRFATGFEELRTKLAPGQSFRGKAENLAAEYKGERTLREVPADPIVALEARRLSLSDEDKDVYGSFTEQQKLVADVLMGKASASAMISNVNDDAAKAITYLLDILRTYKAGEAFIFTLPFAGGTMRLEQGRNSAVYLSAGSRKMMLPHSVSLMADHLEADITANLSKYGNIDVLAMVDRKAIYSDKGYNKGEEIRKRNLFCSVLKNYTGKNASFFTNLTYVQIREAVERITGAKNEQDKTTAIQNIITLAQDTDKKGIFTDAQTEGLVKSYYDNMGMELEREAITVELAPEQKKAAQPGIPQWSDDEQAVVNLISDVIFSKNTWKADAEQLRKEGENRGERLTAALVDNAHAMILIMRDRSLLDRTMDKMDFPEIEVEQEEPGENKLSFKDALINDLNSIFDDPAMKKLEEKAKRGADEGTLKLEMGEIMMDKQAKGSLGLVEGRIEMRCDQITESMQKEISGYVDEAFKEANARQDVLQLPDPYERGLSAAQQRERIRQRSNEINARLEQEYHSSSGQGNFIKTVLKDYFTGSDTLSRRAMVAAMMRNSQPKKDLSKLSEQEKDKERIRVRGNMLGGYLKGAGSLLQKMLQGLDENGMPEAMKLALADMKSNLAPIPDMVVRARLDVLIARSNDEITKITVDRSLGAASVGQAFLCRLFGPNLPQDGKEVVIKLLRPEARNRMILEKKIILDSAQKADPQGALKATYEGQLAKIEEEFDLRIEEKNAKAGLIYSKGDPSVQTVGMEGLLLATTDTMVLEKADGTTVDRFMNDTRELRDRMLGSFYQYDEENKLITDPVTGRPKLLVKQGGSSDITKARKTLEKQLQTLVKRQKILAKVGEKWVSEGIFGSGFYHGDMHAGNIMIDDEKATIIDYGNAIQLTREQQVEITRLTAAVSVGKTEDFLLAFKTLLTMQGGEAAEAKWNAHEAQMRTEVEKVFAVGAKELSGQMISLLLMRAQAIGLEVPAAVNSFSQSQIRLQNTIDSFNDCIFAIRKDIEDLSALEVEEPVIDLALMIQREHKANGGNEADIITGYLNMISVDATALYKEIKKTGSRAVLDFNNNYMQRLPEGKRQEVQAKLNELRDAQARRRGNLNKYEDDVVEAYLEAFKGSRKQSQFAQLVITNLDKTDADTISRMDRELEIYFADTALNGNELRDAYEAFRAAQRENAPGKEQLRDLFADLYLSASEDRLRGMLSQTRSNAYIPKSFFEVMADVTNNNLMASLDRLGLAKAASYTREIKRRELKVDRNRPVYREEGIYESPLVASIRKKVAVSMPGNLPEIYHDVKKDREFMAEIAAREEAIRKLSSETARDNAVYFKNKDDEVGGEEAAKALRDTSLRQIWDSIVADHITGKNWLSRTSQRSIEKGTDQNSTPFLRVFAKINEIMDAEFKLIEAEKDFMKRQKLEQKWYETFVKNARDGGGEEYFLKVMKGEELPDHAMAELKDLEGGEIEAAKKLAASLMMLFGQKIEKSYGAREKLFKIKDEEIKERLWEIKQATDNRFKSVDNYITFCRQDETRTPFDRKYLEEGGSRLYAKDVVARGWNVPGCEELFAAAFEAVTAGDKTKEYVDSFGVLLGDLLRTKPENKEQQKLILDIMQRCANRAGETDLKNPDSKQGITNAKARNIIWLADRVKNEVEGKKQIHANKTAYFRYLYAKSANEDFEEDFLDKGTIESFYSYYVTRSEKPYMSLISDEDKKNKKEQVNPETIREQLKIYDFEPETVDVLADTLLPVIKGESEMAELLASLISFAVTTVDKPDPKAFKRQIKKRRRLVLDTALSLLEMDEGSSTFAKENMINGAGVLKKENRDSLRKQLIRERDEGDALRTRRHEEQGINDGPSHPVSESEKYTGIIRDEKLDEIEENARNYATVDEFQNGGKDVPYYDAICARVAVDFDILSKLDADKKEDLKKADFIIERLRTHRALIDMDIDDFHVACAKDAERRKKTGVSPADDELSLIGFTEKKPQKAPVVKPEARKEDKAAQEKERQEKERIEKEKKEAQEKEKKAAEEKARQEKERLEKEKKAAQDKESLKAQWEEEDRLIEERRQKKKLQREKEFAAMKPGDKVMEPLEEIKRKGYRIYYDFNRKLKRDPSYWNHTAELDAEIQKVEEEIEAFMDSVLNSDYLKVLTKDERLEYTMGVNHGWRMDAAKKKRYLTDFRRTLKYYQDERAHIGRMIGLNAKRLQASLDTTDGVKFAKKSNSGLLFEKMCSIKANFSLDDKNIYTDFTEIMEKAKKEVEKEEGKAADLKLEDLSKSDFATLKESNPYLAHMLLTDYKVRHCDELKLTRIDPTKDIIMLKDGAFTNILRDEKTGTYTAVFRKVDQKSPNSMLGDNYEKAESSKTYKIYPDPRMMVPIGGVERQGRNNLQGFRGICGPASAVYAINQLYGIELTSEAVNVDLLTRLGHYRYEKHYELDEDGQTISDGNGGLKRSEVYKSSEGGTDFCQLRDLFTAFNLKSEHIRHNDAKAKPLEIAKAIKAGAQVQLGVNSTLLWSYDDDAETMKKDEEIIDSVTKGPEDWKRGEAHCSHWVNLCGVYYEQDGDENGIPAGFIVRDTGNGSMSRMSLEKFERCFNGIPGLEINDTRLLIVTRDNESPEEIKAKEDYRQKCEAQKGKIEKYKNIVKASLAIVRSLMVEREFMEKQIERLKSGDKTYNHGAVMMDWEEVKRPREQLHQAYLYALEENKEDAENLKNNNSVKKAIERRHKIMVANNGRYYEWMRLANLTEDYAQQVIGNRETAEKIPDDVWAKDKSSDLLAKVMEIKPGQDGKADLTETEAIVSEALKAGLKLESVTKADYQKLEKQNPYAAKRLYHDFIIRKGEEKELAFSTETDITKFGTALGDVYFTDEKSGENFIVLFGKKDKISGKCTKVKKKYEVYPDPRTVNDEYTDANCVDGFVDISGIATCVSMINKHYGMNVTGIDKGVVFMKELGLVKTEDAIDTLQNGDIRMEDGKPVKLGYPDLSKSGGVEVSDMKHLFTSYGLKNEVYDATDSANASVEKLAEYVMAGKSVGVSVDKKRLNGEPDDPYDLSKETKAEEFISIMCVYKEQGSDKPEGFFIKRAGSSEMDMVTMEEFRRLYLGTQTKPVVGGKVIVA